MSTIASLAAEFNAQPDEVAAFLDLGRDYDETADLDEATEAKYREQRAAGRVVVDYQCEVIVPGTDGDTETVDLRDLAADRLSALRDEAAVAGDSALVATIDSIAGRAVDFSE